VRRSSALDPPLLNIPNEARARALSLSLSLSRSLNISASARALDETYACHGRHGTRK